MSSIFTSNQRQEHAHFLPLTTTNSTRWRKLVEGGSEHSFGIHVADIAGMPKSIVKRANVILKQLEKNNDQVGEVSKNAINKLDEPNENVQLSFFKLDDPVLIQIRDEFLHLDINNLTPVEALNKLNDIKKIVKG